MVMQERDNLTQEIGQLKKSLEELVQKVNYIVDRQAERGVVGPLTTPSFKSSQASSPDWTLVGKRCDICDWRKRVIARGEVHAVNPSAHVHGVELGEGNLSSSSAVAAVAISSSSSQKSGNGLGATKASFLGGMKLRQGKLMAPMGRRSFTVSAAAAPAPDRPLWFPGSTPPPWLDGSLPGDFGFDPLGLGSDPESLRWNQQAELVHCRWAMLGAAGIFIPEFLTKIGILNTPSWYTAGELEYFTDKTTLFIVELIFIGWAEGRRWADIIKPGCVNTDPIFPNNKLTGTDVGYPGGLWFDPLGWGTGSPEKLKELRTKEIKNGRLAMLAVMGAWFQAVYTGTGPIDNLFAHLADPGHATIFAAFTPK